MGKLNLRSHKDDYYKGAVEVSPLGVRIGEVARIHGLSGKEIYSKFGNEKPSRLRDWTHFTSRWGKVSKTKLYTQVLKWVRDEESSAEVLDK